jgi:hypothetical protein
MARTTEVRTLVARVRETLQDQDYTGLRWPEKGLIVVTNLGQLALAKYLPSAGASVDVVKLGAGTRQVFTSVAAVDIKRGDPSQPNDQTVYPIRVRRLIRNMGENGLTPGRAIRQVELEALDLADPDWHTEANGTAVREWTTAGNVPTALYVSPAAPDHWVEIEWSVEPTRVPPGGDEGAELYTPDGNNTLLGIPDHLVDELHAYVVAVCLLKGSKQNQNIPKSQVWAGIFTNSLNALAEAETGTNPKLQLLPFADEISALGA